MDSSEPKPAIKRLVQRSYAIIYSKLKADPASRHLRGPATAGALVVIAGPPVASRFALRRPDALKSPPTKALAQETAIPGPNRAGDHRTGSLAAGSHPLYRLKRAETPSALCAPPLAQPQREIPQAPHRAYVTDLRSYPTNLDAVNTKKTRKGTAVLPPEELLYDLLRKYLWRNAFALSTAKVL